MKTITIYRLIRRRVNTWIDKAKYYPEIEQRISIANKLMECGEPKNWVKL